MATTIVSSGVPGIRIGKITVADLWDALAKGYDDFKALPTHAVFLAVVYPILGLILVRFVQGRSLLPMIFPLIAGFALIGPLAAVGLYELSRRREQGLESTGRHIYDVWHTRCGSTCLALGAGLLFIFFLWLLAARAIYYSAFGDTMPASVEDFFRMVFTTQEGRMLIVTGNIVGFLFAVLVFTLSVVSFPMVLDRRVGAATAMSTSLRAVAANPGPLAVWGLIIAAALVIGSLPLFIGLIVVVPVLGHASWHLYRKLVPE
jgi:uncharacterized membrane protein